MKIVWVTDIHLNFIDIKEREDFYQSIIKTNLDALLISGDIAEAPSVTGLLKEMATFIQQPIYFILGNHDYYHSSVKLVKKKMISLSKTEVLLNWLPITGPHILNSETILVGQDGWADGRLGDYQNSPVSLVDSRLIIDLFHRKIEGKHKLLEKMQELADTDAHNLYNNLKQAIEYNPKKIIILTHVPPFKETSLYEGKISDDNFQPYFTSKATGDVLIKIANNYPSIEFLVLCGHTHHECFYQASNNLTIKVGVAEYGHPIVQEVIEI